MPRLLSRFSLAAIVLALAIGLGGCVRDDAHGPQRSAPDRLAHCPDTPNCVSSQMAPDSAHYVAPLAFAGPASAARRALRALLDARDDVTVEQVEARFIHAVFQTTIGFVDDVSFIVRPQRGVIDVRSASRMGYYDFGVNRRRVEALHADLAARLRAAPGY